MGVEEYMIEEDFDNDRDRTRSWRYERTWIDEFISSCRHMIELSQRAFSETSKVVQISYQQFKAWNDSNREYKQKYNYWHITHGEAMGL